MFMVMSSIAVVEDITNTFISLGFFVLLNVVGQITHFICLLLSLTALCTNPFGILKYCFPSYFIAFATTSAYVLIDMPQHFGDQDLFSYLSNSNEE